MEGPLKVLFFFSYFFKICFEESCYLPYGCNASQSVIVWSQPWPHILVAAAGQVAAVSLTLLSTCTSHPYEVMAAPCEELGSHRLTMGGFLCIFSRGDYTFDVGLSSLD